MQNLIGKLITGFWPYLVAILAVVIVGVAIYVKYTMLQTELDTAHKDLKDSQAQVTNLTAAKAQLTQNVKEALQQLQDLTQQRQLEQQQAQQLANNQAEENQSLTSRLEQINKDLTNDKDQCAFAAMPDSLYRMLNNTNPADYIRRQDNNDQSPGTGTPNATSGNPPAGKK